MERPGGLHAGVAADEGDADAHLGVPVDFAGRLGWPRDAGFGRAFARRAGQCRNPARCSR
eukprot:8344003-Lingulodinium_polyedra.AAC.1